MTDRCDLIIGSKVYRDWVEVQVTRSLRDLASSFSLSVSERWAGSGEPWRIRPGDEAVVRLGGITAITGYVDAYQPAYDEQSHGVQIVGRSRTADLVDSSAVVPDGELKGYKLAAVSRRLTEPHGVGVVVKMPEGEPFPSVDIQQGETSAEVIDRLARLRGGAPHDDAEGNLVLERIDVNASAAAQLVEGQNIKRASAVLRNDMRYSEYIAKGQRPGTDEEWGEDAAGQSATVKDPHVKRNRPLIVVAEDPADEEALRERADWEAATRAAESVRASVTVQGWTYAGGRLWEPGMVVSLDSPMLAIKRRMLVERVTYLQNDAEGTITIMELVPPEAATPEPATGEDGDGTSSPDTRTYDDIWTETKPEDRAQ